MTPSVLVLSFAVGAFIVLALWRPAPPSDRQRRWVSRSPSLPQWLAPALVLAGTALLVGGLIGIVMGALAAIGVSLALPRFESIGARRDRLARDRALPLFVDLVAACLAAGVNTDESLLAAASAVGEPLRTEIEHVVTSIRWGADPVTAWVGLRQVDGLAELAQAVLRSIESGASLAELLPQLARDARDRKRSRVEARTRTAGVRLMAPLGLMFLPAFVLLGVVPVVVSWADLILGF